MGGTWGGKERIGKRGGRRGCKLVTLASAGRQWWVEVGEKEENDGKSEKFACS